MSPECSGQSSHALENAARFGLSSRVGHAVTDEEWAQMRAKLLEFILFQGQSPFCTGECADLKL
jgi:hypothetical protein